MGWNSILVKLAPVCQPGNTAEESLPNFDVLGVCVEFYLSGRIKG